MLERSNVVSGADAWSSRVALAGQRQPEPSECSHLAAMAAYRALEAALQCLDRLPAELDREKLASPLFAAMMCAYTVLDTPVRAAAHGDGLREGRRLVAHAYESLLESTPADGADRLVQLLMEAHAALRLGSEAHASLALGPSPVALDPFLADTFVGDCTSNG